MTFNQKAHLEKMHKRRRQQTLKAIDEAITYLLAMRQPINFSRVANQSGVSRSSLYSIPGIKEKIAYYREQAILESNKTLTNSIKDDQIKSLKRKIHRLENENKELVIKNKMLYGKIFERD
ncbi:transposase [Listeria monocytogenes]|nr:transposase [Listeria monocytogenes]